MGNQSGDVTPRSVQFQVQGKKCYLAEMAPGVWGLNLRLANVNFDSTPSLEITQLEGDRFRVVLNNVWFDTDELSAQKISRLVRGHSL